MPSLVRNCLLMLENITQSNRSDALMIEELSVTHEVKELPKPITINAGITRSEDYWELYTHCNPGFCVVKNQNGCQVFDPRKWFRGTIFYH